jgi:hypothetical protein
MNNFIQGDQCGHRGGWWIDDMRFCGVHRFQAELKYGKEAVRRDDWVIGRDTEPPSKPNEPGMRVNVVRARDAEERGQGICRTCLAPIWDEGGTIGGDHRAKGWSDRIERGGDSLVCFKSLDYRHEPLTGREAAIYDHAYELGAERKASDQ